MRGMNMRHPCMYFSEKDVSGLRERIKTDPIAAQRYRLIVKDREALLAEDFLTEEYANSVYDQHGKYYEVGGQIDRMNEVLGSAWLIERDTACAEKLKALMKHLCGFAGWVGPDNKDQAVPRRSELTTAQITRGLAYLFDILYDYLTPPERETAAHSIMEKGAMPLLMDWVLHATRIHAMDSMGHNWWAVCVASGAIGVLPLRDFTGEAQWSSLLDQAEAALISFLTYRGNTLFNKPASYDSKGLFYESVGYFSFGTGELLRYMDAAEHIRGPREALRANLPEGLDKAILSFAYPTAKTPGILFANFGDGGEDSDIIGMLRPYLRLGFDSPAARTYVARRCPHRTFLDLMRPELFGKGSFEGVPKTSVFPETGYAFLRSGWEDDATLLSVKCGYTWNHAHADAGHFMLWDRGEALLPDGGTCSYGSPLYRTYFCKDEAHNVLLIGNKGQDPEDQYRGSKFPGKIFDFYEGRDFVYIGADATGPLRHLASRVYRNFIWIENRVLVLIDDVRCNGENTVQALLHFNGARTEGERNGLPCTRIRGEKTGLDILHVYPETAVNEVTDCTDGERVLTHMEYSTVTPAKSVLAIKVFLLRPEENGIAVRALHGDAAEGVQITENDIGVTRRIWFNLQADGRRMHLNSNNVIDGFETDAYFFMRTLANDKETDLLACASYHRSPGETGFGAYIKETREIEM